MACATLMRAVSTATVRRPGVCSRMVMPVPGTGAYCRSLSNQYNHTPRPPVLAVRDGAARVIVRRETIEDLLALDVDEPSPSQEVR